MTTSDLSGVCKPFGVSKALAESVYEEFYNQVTFVFIFITDYANTVSICY